MALDAFVEELGELRRDLGEPETMRLKWRWKRERPWLHAAPIDLVRRRKPAFRYPDQLWLSLYRPDARSADRPVVEVSVEPTAAIEAVPQRSDAEVFGVVNAGHAVVVRVGGRLHWPIYPATLTLRAPRLG